MSLYESVAMAATNFKKILQPVARLWYVTWEPKVPIINKNSHTHTVNCLMAVNSSGVYYGVTQYIKKA